MNVISLVIGSVGGGILRRVTMATESRIAGSIALVVVLAACGSGGSTTQPSVEPSASSAAPTAQSTPGSQASTTDTDWGPIWDRLPNGFPTYPGSTPDEEGAGGPASAVLVVDGVDAKDVVTAFQAELEKRGFATIGSPDALEDGGYVLEMTGPSDGCQVEVTVTPTGGLTTTRILYGAACPFS